MSLNTAREFASKHKWWIAAAIVVAAGYTIGKDMALTQNERDAIQTSAGAQS